MGLDSFSTVLAIWWRSCLRRDSLVIENDSSPGLAVPETIDKRDGDLITCLADNGLNLHNFIGYFITAAMMRDFSTGDKHFMI